VFFIDIYVKTDGAWNKVNVENGAKIKYMNQVILISFDVNGTTYEAEEGMTWYEWVESDYNTDSYGVNEEDLQDGITVGIDFSILIEAETGNTVQADDVINAGMEYSLEEVDHG
jgi:hypothetical protein